jgi:hypothetical protein
MVEINVEINDDSVAAVTWAAEDQYTQALAFMRQAADSWRAWATRCDTRANRYQLIIEREQADASEARGLAASWDRVAYGVEQGLITADDVTVSLEYAESRLAARTLQASAGIEAMTVDDLRAVFGEPVEGHDYAEVPPAQIVPRSLAEDAGDGEQPWGKSGAPV